MKPYCKRGHPRVLDNVDKTGKCKRCAADAQAVRRRRNRAQQKVYWERFYATHKAYKKAYDRLYFLSRYQPVRESTRYRQLCALLAYEALTEGPQSTVGAF